MHTLDNGHTKIIKNPFLKHLLRLPPSQPLLLQHPPIVILPRIVRIQDQKLTLPQLPVIVHSHNGIRVLASPIHDRAPRPQKMVFKLLALLHDLFAVRYVQDFAVDAWGCDFGDQPGDLCCADPGVGAFELSGSVELVEFLLDLYYGQHVLHWLCQVGLDFQPTYQGLERSVRASPSIVVEVLVAVMEVLIHAFCHYDLEFVFICIFRKCMRVKNFFRVGPQAVKNRNFTYFIIKLFGRQLLLDKQAYFISKNFLISLLFNIKQYWIVTMETTVLLNTSCFIVIQNRLDQSLYLELQEWNNLISFIIFLFVILLVYTFAVLAVEFVPYLFGLCLARVKYLLKFANTTKWFIFTIILNCKSNQIHVEPNISIKSKINNHKTLNNVINLIRLAYHKFLQHLFFILFGNLLLYLSNSTCISCADTSGQQL